MKMKISHILKRALYPENATILPLGICIVVYLLILFNGMVTTNLSSYLPQLVKKFNVSEVDTGRYVGVVSSAMSVSRVISSTMWGYICDKFGRKLSLVWAGSGLAITTFMFGFSFNFIWTVVTRSMQGLCMGLIVINKSIISDIADDTNLSTGLSIIFSAINIGYILGPSMSGFLVFPTEKYPKVFSKGSFFDTFKVFLPNFIIATVLTISLVITLFLLPKKEKQENAFGNKLINEQLEKRVLPESANINTDTNDLYIVEGPSFSEKTFLLPKRRSYKLSKFFLCCDKFKKSKYRRLFINKSFLLSVFLYCLFSMTTVGYEDLFPVFAATKVKYNGLSMNTSDIGLLYLITGLSIILIQFLAINKFINRFGAKKVFCGSTLLFSAFVFLLPVDAMIKNRTVLWIALWLTQCLIRSMYSAGILCINVFINNSVEPEFLGFANGIGLSLTSIGRALGSVCFGLAYSWSMKNLKNALSLNKSVVFPLNEYFAFTLLSASALVVLSVATCLPESINKKYSPPQVDNQEIKRNLKV